MARAPSPPRGAKGAVSAYGPEDPERVQLNKCLIGFLTHSGFGHGGNGYEGIAFLLQQFRDSGLRDPADPQHGVDLAALAAQTADEYARYKSDKQTAGSLDLQKIPGVNHPVFKGKPVNHDPREVWVHHLFAHAGEHEQQRQVGAAPDQHRAQKVVHHHGDERKREQLFRKFAVCVSLTILVSAFVSLTLKPMVASRFLSGESRTHGRIYNGAESVFGGMLGFCERTLDIALRFGLATLLVFIAAVALTVAL